MDLKEYEKNILLVEDNEDFREILTDFLHGNGFRVYSADSVDQALSQMRTVKPDLALVDVSLRDSSGFELCKIVKNDEEFAGIPIIIISAYCGLQEKIRAFKSGAERYFCKPFPLDALLNEVAYFTSRAAAV